MFLSNNTYTCRLQLLLLLLVSSSLTIILHAIGLEFFLYWSLWWFDILMHALGGFSLGLLCVLLFPDRYRYLRYIILFGVIIGWEVFEVVFINIETGTVSYAIDTVLDLVIGFTAAHIAIRFSCDSCV